MPRPRICLLAPAALLPLPAAGQDAAALHVSNTDACSGLRAGVPLLEALGAADALALGPAGIEGVDHHCAFEPALDLTAPDQSISTHTGYCEVAGVITPQLFTFRIEREETPRVSLHEGGEQPTVFFACP